MMSTNDSNKGYRPSEMEGYGYGDEGGSMGSSFGAMHLPRQSSTGSTGGPAPAHDQSQNKKPFNYLGTKGYLDSMFANVNYDLLISKTFYFFFFAAFGSLFPLIAVYFKQLGMNPVQTGVLIGFRPFVEFMAGPFWGNIAEKWRKFKEILLFALFCWVAFTLALAFIGPPANSCLVHNGTHIVVAPPWTMHDRTKRSTITEPLDFSYSDMHNYERQLDSARTYFFRPSRAKEIMDGEVPLEERKREDDVDNKDAKRNETIPMEGGGKTNDKDKNGDKYKNGKDDKEGDSKDSAKGGDISKDKDKSKAEGTKDKDNGGKDDKSGKKEDNKDNKGKKEDKDDKPYVVRYLPHPSIDAYGMSPLPLDHKDIANLDEIDVHGLVSPPLSAVVYAQKDINEVFFILLVLMVIGEFVSSPAIALADAATLGYLGEDTESYGKHRMFGSVGWAVAMFIVGIALDYSNIFPNHPCGNEQLVDRNYTVCFAVFSVLMCCAFLTATQFKFDTDGQQTIPLAEMMKDKIQQKIGKKKRVDREQLIEEEDDEDSPVDRYDRYVDPNRTGAAVPHPAYDAYLKSESQERKVQISLQDHGGSMISDATIQEGGERHSTFIPRGKPGQVGTLPQWMTVMKMLGTVQHMSSIFVLWYMGFGVGLVFAFLFWHLQDLQGTPTLFGFASVINHVSEILAFFFSKKLISRYGHVKVMYIGLVGNVVRFMYISWLRNPWWVLPFELLQGLTHAAMWANGCSFVSHSIPAHLRPTAQGILSAIHHGLGRGCGAIIGGAFVHGFGSEATFRGYGIATLVLLAGYISLNYFYLGKYAPDLPAGPPGDQASQGTAPMEETSHLAPCGVPMSSMTHSLSGNKLDQGGYNQGYGSSAPKTTNGYLDPGASQSQGGGGASNQPPYYQYHLNPTGSKITLGDPQHIRSKVSKPADCAAIRKSFEAYDEVLEGHINKQHHTHALIMNNAPTMPTQLYLQQPDNIHPDQDLF